ncbi:MAG TPA: hypothetical protein VN958_09615 [Chitinophagaceae bacterium]|nr:hypothetical protein [Chitinophagaceae bacterium]
MKHKFFTLFFSVPMCSNAFVQPVIRGQKTIGGKGDDPFSGMYLTKDGGLIMGGSS